MIDLTDTANPFEIAFFDRGPMHEEHLIVGGYWSTYYYQGRIYGTEIIRGLDVLELLPSDYISEAEIAAAAMANEGDRFNPQRQLAVNWPDHPVVALAYVDQLERSGALEADQVDALRSALAADGDPSAEKLSELATSLEEGATASSMQDQERRTALVEVLRELVD